MTNGIGFEETWLWQKAFVDSRSDSSLEEQRFFEQRYLELREKITPLVNRISVELPGITVHDISHLDALWDTASLMAEDAVKVNPPEAFVFGASVLLHDAAMSLAAYRNGIEDVRNTMAWKDAVARLLLVRKESDLETFDPENLPLEYTNQLIPDVLRRLHAEWAEKLVEQAWVSNEEQFYLIDDVELRNFYGQVIGQIAHSHWWSIQKVEAELNENLGALPLRTRNTVDKIKLACLLRVADALNLDARRAPRFIRAIAQPSGSSELHWSFQERLARPHIEHDAVVFTTGNSFDREDAEAWWLAYDTLNAVDRELNDVDQLLQSGGREVFKARRVKGAGSPEKMSRTVTTRDWRPVDARLQVSDVPRIVENLGGAKLYGDNPRIALRELIQNAADAVQARRRFEERENDWGVIKVGIFQRGDSDWLFVEDNGIGMSEMVLTGSLIDFGNSFWRSPLAMEEFPGLMAAGMQAIGRFGIGFFAVFMLGPEVRVFSRRCDKGIEAGRLLEFRDGTAARPILSPAEANDLPRDGGTRVEVKLKQPATSEGGLLSSGDVPHQPYTLTLVVGAVAPNLNISLTIEEQTELTSLSSPKDWISLPEEQFLSRLDPAAIKKEQFLSSLDPAVTQKDENKGSGTGLMRSIIGEEGIIYGRAFISPYNYYSSEKGCMTVGGLRANRLWNISGVFIGEVVTVSRDVAKPLVDSQSLAKWATEQSELIADKIRDEEQQAKSAEVILVCGGDVGSLKILRWGTDWLNSQELSERLQEEDVFHVSFDGEFDYDEDLDDVHPRDFREDFDQSDDIAVVLKHDGKIISDNSLQWPDIPTKETNISNSQVAAHVGKIIQDTWGQDVEEFIETRSVGVVGRVEIMREVMIFRRYGED